MHTNAGYVRKPGTYIPKRGVSGKSRLRGIECRSEGGMHDTRRRCTEGKLGWKRLTSKGGMRKGYVTHALSNAHAQTLTCQPVRSNLTPTPAPYQRDRLIRPHYRPCKHNNNKLCYKKNSTRRGKRPTLDIDSRYDQSTANSARKPDHT